MDEELNPNPEGVPPNVDIVVREANVTREEATQLLRANGDDIVEAILAAPESMCCITGRQKPCKSTTLHELLQIPVMASVDSRPLYSGLIPSGLCLEKDDLKIPSFIMNDPEIKQLFKKYFFNCRYWQ